MVMEPELVKTEKGWKIERPKETIYMHANM